MATVTNPDSEAVLALKKNSGYKSALSRWRSAAQTDGLTKHANDALLQMFDGYHDAPYTAVGLPTGVNERIVVHDIQRSLTITKPPTLGAGSSWDCHIAFNQSAGGSDGGIGFPNIFNGGALSLQSVYGSYSSQAAESAAVGDKPFFEAPILVSRKPAGQNTFGLNADTANNTFGIVDIPHQFLDGRCRVIGMSFEVVNATAPLYTSGQCGVYALPSNRRLEVESISSTYGTGTHVYDTATGSDLGPSTTSLFCGSPHKSSIATAPPSNVSIAARSHNWTTWHAKEGCYVNAVYEELPSMEAPLPVKRFVEDRAAPAGATYQTLMGVKDGYFPASDLTVGARRLLVQSDTSSTSPLGNPAASSFDFTHWVKPTVDIPVRRSGAYFTGLNENSVLELKCRFIIERIPDIFDERLYSLASLPPAADPRFWEMYSRVCNSIPPGCMQTENPLGEWFNTLTDTVKRWAPVVGNTIGNFVPGASALGNVIGKVAGVANAMNSSPAKAAEKDKKVAKKTASKSESAKPLKKG